MRRVVVLAMVFLAACGAGEQLFAPDLTPINEGGSMKLSSPAFENNEEVPRKYTCDGNDENPPLLISDVLVGTTSFVLIMDDPDAPHGTWDHWVVFNIPANTVTIREGENPAGVLGKNSWGKLGYGGPCPPSGEHRYHFKLYALNAMLDLPEGATKKEVERAMEGRILEQAELTGTYQRN